MEFPQHDVAILPMSNSFAAGFQEVWTALEDQRARLLRDLQAVERDTEVIKRAVEIASRPLYAPRLGQGQPSSPPAGRFVASPGDAAIVYTPRPGLVARQQRLDRRPRRIVKPALRRHRSHPSRDSRPESETSTRFLALIRVSTLGRRRRVEPLRRAKAPRRAKRPAPAPPLRPPGSSPTPGASLHGRARREGVHRRLGDDVE